MDPISMIALLGIIWLASALVVIKLGCNNGRLVDGDDIVMAALFGPVSFLIIAWFKVSDDVLAFRRRAVRYLSDLWARLQKSMSGY